MKNIFKKIIILLILCFSLFVFGCNSESKSDASYDNSSPEIGTESKGDGSEVVIDTNRKVIYKVTLNITTQNVSNGVKKYNQKIVDLGGYISSSRVSNNYGEIIYKIPSSKLNEFLDFSGEDEEVVEKTISSNDVTSKYNQIEQRLEVLYASRSSYVSMLEKSSSLSETIQLQNAINDIDTEIKYLEEQKASYDAIIDYSTITIYFNKVKEEVKKQSWFSKYWKYVVNFFTGLGKFVLYLLPILVVGGVIVTVILIVDKVVKRKKNKNKIE